MKPIFNLLFIVCFAHFTHAQASDNYNQLWKEVEKFEKEGLPKSALEVVDQISKKAELSKNNVQQIKTLLFKSKYALILEEDAQLKIVNDFKSAIAQNESPTKNILQNMLATLYWQYFNQNRWKFYNRTKTSEKLDDLDFRTWDLQTLFNEIHLYYQASLKNGLILNKSELKDYDAILIKQNESERYRPSLYDLLAHNALEFYKTDENSITKPAYKFEIDDPKYLGTFNDFGRHRFTTKDSTSLQYHALKIYQDLNKAHQFDSLPYAKVYVDIERLRFVFEHATFSEKENVLLQTLKTSSERWNNANVDVAALYDFEIAKLYFNQGKTYEPETNTQHRWKIKEAIEVCDAVIVKYSKSQGAKKCALLKSQILRPSLNITSEALIPIDKNALALVTYKNIDTINFKIGKVSENDREILNNYDPQNQYEVLSKMNAIEQWNLTLPNENDFQEHTTEFGIPELPNGRYVIFGQLQNDMKTFAFKTIQVTNTAYVSFVDTNEAIYQFIDRINGKPIAGASVDLSYQLGYNGTFKKETYTTNQRGEIYILKNSSPKTRLRISILHNNDRAIFEDTYLGRRYNSRSSKNNKETYRGFVFTDRSIYRPGQTLYFKGIVLSKQDNNSQLVKNETIDVTLFNTNGENVKVLNLKTNDYGSVSGEFIIPNNGLTGLYSIRMKGSNNLNTYNSISVEEYKRPKFEAKFLPITDTFKVNDTIKVKGNALAYAGSVISNAKVSYRVHRNVQFPRWYYWSRPAYAVEAQEITYGETITDAQGYFEIDFKAIPDLSAAKASLPVFNYEITADITDLNGETRSATTIVNVGYHTMKAALAVKTQLNKNNKNENITISTTNLNGESVSAVGKIELFKLQAPEQVLRNRPWKAPDYNLYSEQEFKSMFPHNAYNNEHDSKQWSKGQLMWSKDFDTSSSNTLDLGNMKRWASGKYVFVLTAKDQFNQVVKDEIQTTIFSDNDETISDNQLFNVSMDQSEYQPGDEAKITFGSAAEDLYVMVRIEKDGKLSENQLLHFKNNKQTITVPVTKNDIGGFMIHYSFAFQNSYTHGMNLVVVPYPKTELDIETQTFRDKLQPGTDETWTFKIKGPKGDKVSAELLASMYDASLDQFKPHSWSFNPIDKPVYYAAFRIGTGQSFGINQFNVQNLPSAIYNYSSQYYDRLNYFGLDIGSRRYLMRSKAIRSELSTVTSESIEMMEVEEVLDEVVVADSAIAFRDGDVGIKNNPEQQQTTFDDIQIRKNLNETAFFFPQLQTDKDGNVSFKFTTPEALTKWKLQLLAHTKTLESKVSTRETVTQKELMVFPNTPRFLRQGDIIVLSTKISNLSNSILNGQAQIILENALTNEDVTDQLLLLTTRSNPKPHKYKDKITDFTVDRNGNIDVSWRLLIDKDIQAVTYKIVAKAGTFSDGEQNILPVLSNRMLVTETLPMWIKSGESRTFTLDKLKTSNSSTLKHHKLTLEITSNPAWYAIQALPYLMEYPHDCNEQIFSRYYANTLASHIANSNPRIKAVFDQWRNSDALLSNLEKNEELKSLLIEDTPWLRDAQSETEQKKRIALLFDLNKMSSERSATKRKLENNQLSNGAWSWFNGGRSNRFITQHIITGFGHLKQLHVVSDKNDMAMIKKAISFLDQEFVNEYHNIRTYNPKADLSKDHLSHNQLHYLYMRSFFPEISISEETKTIIDYYQTQIRDYWARRSLYSKGLMALIAHRAKDKATAARIIKSLRENSITSDELGMYWKANANSWYWYQAPIETQALLIEAFSEIENDEETINNLKIWLLKNKQTNRWKTTKATSDAVYALLLQGSDWLSVSEMVAVTIGEQPISPMQLEDVKIEAGTGYYKTSWSGSEISNDMATVNLTKKEDGIAWGGLYWQYFEDMDKITSAETPLKLNKKLFKKTNTPQGEQLVEITSDTKLRVGDLVRVRIDLRSDRTMEFLHMKDMRASGLEPINVLSQYKWQDGLGYYESTKDASTNFFIDYLPKGIYVFEYDLRVNNAGNMSNGITTIQSMYAPEFSSHSEGVRIAVESD